MGKMKKYFVFLMAAALIILTGCWNDPSDKGIPPKVKPNVPLEGIELSNSTMEVMVSKKQLIYVTYTPDNSSNKTMVWSSSASDIASVDNWGEVTGVKEGTATITAVSEEGGFKAECVVTVIPNVANPVTGVTISDNELTIPTAKRYALKATVAPDDADIKAIIWSSSNPDIASVDSTGVVQGLNAGASTITATTVDGEFTATCAVTVTLDFCVADFESYLDEKGILQNTVGTALGVLNFDATSSGKVEIAATPLDEATAPTGPFTPKTGNGNSALVWGNNNNSDYGLIGVRVGPFLDVTLPAGTTLGDFKALQLDAYFVSGTGNGGANSAGAGWFGAGSPYLRIEGPTITVNGADQNYIQTNGFSGNINVLGNLTFDPTGATTPWSVYQWARGINLGFDVLTMLNDYPEYQSISTFRIGVGLPSGAIYCYMDNFILIHK